MKRIKYMENIFGVLPTNLCNLLEGQFLVAKKLFKFGIFY